MNSAALPTLNLLLRKPWYRFWKLMEAALYRDRSYALHIPFGQRVYTPWFEKDPQSDFWQAMQTVRASGPQWFPIDKCYMLYQFAKRCLQLPGDMAECGVYKGETAQLLAWVLASRKTGTGKLHLFDTFAGMPATCLPDRDYHLPGDFSDTSLEQVRQRLGPHARLCHFHPGVIPETFDEVADVRRYAFVHIDVDIYPAVRDCCEWFWPRLSPGGIMVFNVYGLFPYRYAERVAVDEFFAKRTDQPIVLGTGQAVVIKTT